MPKLMNLSKHYQMNNPRKLCIYIAGKVTGEKLIDCHLKFHHWQIALESMGFDVANPMCLVKDFRTPWDAAMRTCVGELVKCHAVFMLPCWQNSRGAKIEKQIAESLNIPVFTETEDLKRLAKTCQHACSPADKYKGGKCDKMGYHETT